MDKVIEFYEKSAECPYMKKCPFFQAQAEHLSKKKETLQDKCVNKDCLCESTGVCTCDDSCKCSYNINK